MRGDEKAGTANGA